MTLWKNKELFQRPVTHKNPGYSPSMELFYYGSMFSLQLEEVLQEILIRLLGHTICWACIVEFKVAPLLSCTFPQENFPQKTRCWGYCRCRKNGWLSMYSQYVRTLEAECHFQCWFSVLGRNTSSFHVKHSAVYHSTGSTI